MNNNSMVSLLELKEQCFDINKVYIPLLQRNYKWEKSNKDNKPSAEKFARDLYNRYKYHREEIYTIGMITLYEENKKKFQLIDGQQRIITLTLLLKLLDSETEYFMFDFERDEKLEENYIKRSRYLKDINNIKIDEKYMYTDLIRFKENYEMMELVLREEGYDKFEKKDFLKFIFNNVKVLFHLTSSEPVDEFLNINKRKTPFVISDFIKANMIIDAEQTHKKTENNISRISILEIFRKLSLYLFYFEFNYTWELINQGYILNKEENRLKILFCDRYDYNNTINYKYKDEYELLKYYEKILSCINNDIRENNWNTINGFNCLRNIIDNKLRFFSMFGENYNKKVIKLHLEEIFLNLIDNKNRNKISYFIESQLYSQKINTEDYKKLPDKDSENWVYISSKEEINEFKKYYQQYIEEKYNS